MPIRIGSGMRMKILDAVSSMAVSYTHLDVYKRQDAVYAEFLYLLCRRLKQRKQNCYKLRAGFYCSIGNLR